MLARSAIRVDTIFKVPEGDISTEMLCFAIEVWQSNGRSFTLERRPDAPPQGLPVAQSARIHAKRLKLSKFGSLEPDKSDTFVS